MAKNESTSAGTPIAYSYDTVGDRTAAVTGTATTTYAYDQARRLTSYTSPTLTQAYSYNGDGLRTATFTSGIGTSNFTWDTATGSLALLLSDGANDFLYGPNDEPVEQVATASGTATYLSQDAIGSTRLISDGAGAVVGSYTYDPYGQVLTRVGMATSALGYTGQYTDATGLVYLRARYYDPGTAQFLTVDGDVDQTHSPYAYASGDPADKTDPTGMQTACGLVQLLTRIANELAWINAFSPHLSNTDTISFQFGVAYSESSSKGDFWYTPNWNTNNGPNQSYCYGLTACQVANVYNFAHPNNLAMTQYIAATYCITNAAKCLRTGQIQAAWQADFIAIPLLFAPFADSAAAAGLGTDADTSAGGAAADNGPAASTAYPPNRGFLGTPGRTTLRPGIIVDRFGADSGTFASPKGTPFGQRSLPLSSLQKQFNTYEVVQPVEVTGGRVAPWFGQSGGGIQYEFDQPIADLIQSGVLKRLP